MKLIDKYLIRSFIGPFGVCVGVFCLLVLLGRFFDKMSIFNDYQANAVDIASYLLLGLPFWLNLVLPVATLLAVLFSLSQLQAGGELTAMRGAGIAPIRLFRPLFLTGLTLSIFSLIGGLSFLPKLSFESRIIYRAKIKKRDVLSYRKDNLVTAGEGNRHYTIAWLDLDKQAIRGLVIDRFDESNHLAETVTAKEAQYLNPGWRLRDGVVRRFARDKPAEAVEETFAERIVDIPERPADFALFDKEPDDMTGGEMVRRMRRLRLLGAPIHRERVALHMRIALPFANIIVIAIGIPFALRSHQKSRTQTFTYAILIAFLFWGFASVFKSLGEQNRLPAWMAAWAANGIFGLYAVWRLRSLR